MEEMQAKLDAAMLKLEVTKDDNNNTGEVHLNSELVDKEEEESSKQYSLSGILVNSPISSDDDEDEAILTKVIRNQNPFEEDNDLQFEDGDIKFEVGSDALSASFVKPVNDTPVSSFYKKKDSKSNFYCSHTKL